MTGDFDTVKRRIVKIRLEKRAPVLALFTSARLAKHGNFSGPLSNVAGIDVGYFNEKRIRRLIE
jgi:hypothetical protein